MDLCAVQNFTGHAFSCSVRGIAITWWLFILEFLVFLMVFKYVELSTSIRLYLYVSFWLKQQMSLVSVFFYWRKNNL